jgi:histidinol-phosphate aminotransferase
LPLPPRPELNDLEVCPHGGLNYAELLALGISPDSVMDFSVCTNPFMPPPEIRKLSLGEFPINQYPDPEASELKEHLSAKLGVPAHNIIVGSGTTELIRLIALAYFRPGDMVLVLEPTYGEYEVAARIAGATIVKQRMKEIDNFAPQLEETIGLIRHHHPRAVFLCNPNNPTGKYLSRKDIEMILPALGDGLLVIDEAYLSFVAEPWSSQNLISRASVVLLRSMTKDYGLAGLRLGYAVTDEKIVDFLRRVRPPWSVNAIAQKAGSMMLDDDYLEETRPKIREAKQFLLDGLSRLGFRTVPSDAHYFLVKVGDARAFRTALLRRGIQVRDCTSFGLPQYIRISPRTLPECQKFMDIIADLKNKGDL